MRNIWAANGLLMLTAIAWGTTAPVFHELLKTWDPLSITTVRFILTMPLFYIWLRISEGVHRPPLSRRAWCETLMLGFLLVAFAVVLNIGIHLSDPITAAVYSAGAPLVSGVLDWLLNGRRPARTVVLGIPFAVAGGILASVDIADLGGTNFNTAGSLWLLGAVILWPLYSALLQRWLTGLSQLRRTTVSFAAAVPFGIVATAIALASGIETLPNTMPDTRGYVLIGWSVVGTSIVGTLCWNIGVSRLGISVASMFLNFIPVVAIIVSIGFGISPRPEQLAGALLVMIGVAIAQGWHRRLRRRTLPMGE